MAGIKIIVTGNDKKIETMTNDAGEYRVTGLQPGDYDAFPELPDNLAAETSRDRKDDFGRPTGQGSPYEEAEALKRKSPNR